jgi:hypothetical protein
LVFSHNPEFLPKKIFKNDVGFKTMPGNPSSWDFIETFFGDSKKNPTTLIKVFREHAQNTLFFATSDLLPLL